MYDISAGKWGSFINLKGIKESGRIKRMEIPQK